MSFNNSLGSILNSTNNSTIFDLVKLAESGDQCSATLNDVVNSMSGLATTALAVIQTVVAIYQLRALYDVMRGTRKDVR